MQKGNLGPVGGTCSCEIIFLKVVANSQYVRCSGPVSYIWMDTADKAPAGMPVLSDAASVISQPNRWGNTLDMATNSS